MITYTEATLKALKVHEQNQAKRARLVNRILKTRIVFDSAGGLTKWGVLCIVNWPANNAVGLFEFIRQYWGGAGQDRWNNWIESDVDHRFLPNTKVRTYQIRTLGTSDNEFIIETLMRNSIVWNSAWYQSTRGGKYIFEVKL